MVVKSHGFRSRSRRILSRSPRERGKIPVTPRLIEYQPGDYVDIIINPAVHKGMPHKRFHGKTGRIIGKRGRAYIVEVRDGGKIKTLIVRPDHLRPSKSVRKRFFSAPYGAGFMNRERPSKVPAVIIKEVEYIDNLSVHELRALLLEELYPQGYDKFPEINDLQNYVSMFLKLFDGKHLAPEKAKELRERLEKEMNIPKKYAALLVSHLPVSVDEISELLPRDILRNIDPQAQEEIARKMREVLKENF